MYEQSFRDNAIDGLILQVDLESNMLTEDLGVKSLHVGKLMREIEKLRNSATGEGSGSNTASTNSANTSFRLHTFGYGSDHNNSLLKTLAENFEGMYHFVETEQHIKEGFASCLGGLLSTVAQEIQLDIKFNPEVTNMEVHKENTFVP
eukprot:UN00916